MSEETKTEAGAVATTETVAGGSLLDEILKESKLKPTDDGYEITRKGVQAFITEMLGPQHGKERIDKALVDAMIADIDRRISAQLNAIMHNQEFQKLEAAWRGLKFLVDRTDFRENIKVEMLNVSKDDVDQRLRGLARDPEVGPVSPRLLGRVRRPRRQALRDDVRELRLRARAAGHRSAAEVRRGRRHGARAVPRPTPAPSSSASDSYLNLPKLKDLKSLFEGPQYTRWRSFRESEDARYVGLCMPRFLLRLPYGEKTVPVKSFNFTEDVVGQHEAYLWGNVVDRARVARRRFVRQVPLVPEHHRPAGGRYGREPAAAPVRGDGRDPDQDPDRGADHRASRVRALRGGLHRADVPQGLGQRVLLLGELGAEAEVLRPVGRGQGGRDQLPPRHAAPVHVHHDAAGALPEGAAARADRELERADRSAARAERLDQPVRRRHGRSGAGRAVAAPAAQGLDPGRGRRGAARLVPLQPEGAPALQVHGRVVHAVAGRQAGQGVGEKTGGAGSTAPLVVREDSGAAQAVPGAFFLGGACPGEAAGRRGGGDAAAARSGAQRFGSSHSGRRMASFGPCFFRATGPRRGNCAVARA